ncbi:MAG: SDR family NAD(P)-dependent oxidoreductase [Deltaproteobacteria bacterium]|nr:SDR family NAD(P)-dependent oxidoreductase [Deltaproteobacteria bacterium]MBW2382422.1 SDR family NAD(P)-dependent oxidoreductase [Deltaproteobacteria bacterium]MBW2695835.1 SDR family NAD(P)-dependent oxidoreductase [Deltaproteobacteria bacterium]
MTETPASTPARTAVVTGASSGLGVAIARALGALGWRVAVGARRETRLADTARDVEAAGGEAFAHRLDVADPASVDLFFDAVEKRFGRVDVVVNNAGLSQPGRVQDLDPKDIAYEISVNLLGAIQVTRRALSPLLKQGARGDVVFITSDATRQPRPRQSVYTATKAGLEGFSRALSMELEGTGIRSTIVRPGPTLSEYAASWKPGTIAEIMPYWKHFGLQRHNGVMPADAVARAVVLALTTPPGVHLDTIEVQPEAPVND